MWVLFLLLVFLLIATGSLLTVLKVALGVAIGLVLTVAIAVTLFVWWIRRRWRAAMAAGAPGAPGAVTRGSSTIEVLPPRPGTPPPAQDTAPPRVVDVTPLDQREGPASD
jgi:hypothetical protein